MDAVKIMNIQQVLIKAEVARRDHFCSVCAIKMGITGLGAAPEYILYIYKFVAADGGHGNLSLHRGLLLFFSLPYPVPGPTYTSFQLGNPNGFYHQSHRSTPHPTHILP